MVIVDDSYGALTLGTVAQGAERVRVHQDLITGERALAANAERLGLDDFTSLPLGPELFDDATLVLLRLPRSLDRLAEVAALIAAHADPAVTVAAGGRIKHMSTSMNDVLGDYFDRVDVSHARQKSRVLTATGAKPEAVATQWPRTENHDALRYSVASALDTQEPEASEVFPNQLTVAAHGGVFAGTNIDIGTRFLLENLPADELAKHESAVDLACGTGVVATHLALNDPTVTVVASDRSASAVASARATADLNGVGDRVRVAQADGTEAVEPDSQSLILLNPPFHSDAALSTGIAEHLFTDAARALTPGGELWCVWNSHLRYRSALERIVGPTRQIARNRKFTVTASRRREA